jgi:hypothetical protein
VDKALIRQEANDQKESIAGAIDFQLESLWWGGMQPWHRAMNAFDKWRGLVFRVILLRSIPLARQTYQFI